MGGGQALNIAIPSLDKISYIGVYSLGIFGITGSGPVCASSGPSIKARYRNALDDRHLKSGLELFWFAAGKDDTRMETSRAKVKMLRHHGFDVFF